MTSSYDMDDMQTTSFASIASTFSIKAPISQRAGVAEDVVKDVKDSAHYAAHVAGMVHTRTAKAWAQQAASRSAEAIDQAETLGKLVRWRFQAIFVPFTWVLHVLYVILHGS